jgi:hypothetical protein
MTTFLANSESALSARPAGFRQRSIREQLAEPIHPEAECFVHQGRPYLIFGMWDSSSLKAATQRPAHTDPDPSIRGVLVNTTVPAGG